MRPPSQTLSIGSDKKAAGRSYEVSEDEQRASHSTIEDGEEITSHSAEVPILEQGADKQDPCKLDVLSLFPSNHVQRPGLLFYLYFPFGLGIAVVRSSLWIALLLADKAWLTNNDVSIAVLQAVLGVRVTWLHSERIPKHRHVLVSNHCTTGDMMALYRLSERTVHLISSGLPEKIAKTRNHRIDFRHASVASYDQLNSKGESGSIHLFPEGGMTNGIGMMKFNKGFMRFADGLPVVPIALRASLPWGISTHTLNSSFLMNMFWFCFSPYVDLQLTVLPPQTRSKDENKANFVERVQKEIADELDVPIFDFSIQAKKQLIRSSTT